MHANLELIMMTEIRDTYLEILFNYDYCKALGRIQSIMRGFGLLWPDNDEHGNSSLPGGKRRGFINL